MIAKTLFRIIIKLPFPAFLIRQVLILHSFCYKLVGPLASRIEKNAHPKHRLMGYKEWFLGNIAAGDIVLDVGSNTGMMAELLSRKAKFVYGIEIVPGYVDEALTNRQEKNIQYICADATTFDYRECRPIDIVVLSNVLEHIENRHLFLNKLITQICWSDSSSRTLLIRVPMIDRDWITLYKKELRLEYRLDATHFIEYTYEQFEQEMIRSGIEIKSHQVRFGEIYAICQVKG
jgi:SAM-dependent methyltransferase